MAVKFTNNAATTLAAGINSSATSISVTDGSVFPSLSSGEHFYCTFDDTTNTEIVKVTARSGNTLTVVRGQDDTTARAFSSGDKAELRVVAALLEDVKTEVTSTLSVDTFTSDGTSAAFTLSQAPSSEDNLIVFIEGVYQNPGDFTLSGTTLTLDAVPPNTRKVVAYHVSAAVSGNNLNHDQFTYSAGNAPQFTLSIAPIHENNTQVFIDGVYQQKDSYAVSGSTLTLDASPANGATVEVMTFTQTDVNTLPASFVSGLTQVTAVGADHFMIFDATDNALKKSLVSDVLESATSISTSADATAITIDSSENVTFTNNVIIPADLTVDTSTLKVDSTNNRVGIGTTSPNARLVVSDSGDSPVRFISSGQATNYFELANTGGSAMVFSNNNDLVFGTSNSPTERMRINSSGNVGIGNTNPNGFRLYVDSSSTGKGLFVDAQDGGSTALGFSGDGTSTVASFTTHDGLIYIGSENSGGTGSNGELRIEPSTSERMRIDSSGRVGIGTNNPSNPLHVVAPSTHQYPFRSANGQGYYYHGHGNTSYHHNVQSGASTGFYFGSAAYANGGFHTYSDERLKENITNIDSALDKVALMNGVTFDWKDQELRGNGKQFGVIAQDMLKVDKELPDLVEDAEATQEEIDNKELNTQYYSMDYSRLTPYFIEAIKELKADNDALRARIETLENA